MKIVVLFESHGVYTMEEADVGQTGIHIPDEVWDEYQAHEATCACWYERLREIDNIWFNDKINHCPKSSLIRSGFGSTFGASKGELNGR